jgi:hypothetical protein
MPSLCSFAHVPAPQGAHTPRFTIALRAGFAAILLLFAASSVASARAQDADRNILVYGAFAATHLNHLYTVNGTTPGSTLTGSWFEGGNAGVTFNFYQGSSVALGLDFRGGPQIGTHGLGSALAGFKIASQAPILHVKPYTQLSIGWMEQRHNTGSGIAAVTDAETYVAVELLGGIDYPVSSHIDIRVVELGIGFDRVIDTNAINTTAKPTPFTVNSGVVFHF